MTPLARIFAGALIVWTVAGCSLDRSPIAPEDLDAGAGQLDAGRHRDAGGDAQSPPPRDAGPRDGGLDSGPPDSGPRDGGTPDSGPPPSCEETFGGVEGYQEVCEATPARCAMRFDRPGGLGTNTRTCADNCMERGWTCHGSAPAGGGTCTAITVGNCGTALNHQVCACDRP